MRIAILAPIWETVPPPGYGGIELVVSLLADGLVEAGQQPVLFATGDSRSQAPLSWVSPHSLRSQGYSTERILPQAILHVTRVYQQASSFDIIHNHEGGLALSLAPFVKTPTVTTLHGPIDKNNQLFYRSFPGHPFVSLSEAQRRDCPDLNYLATVNNGIDPDLYSIGPKKGYLLFLGRISPEKGTHHAIRAAADAGYPLVIAGKVDPFDRDYFLREISPLIDGSQVRFIGEVGGIKKSLLLQGAMAMLHPVQWPEPFGLVLAEALASGVPVIAIGKGSIPEIIRSGKTGFVVDHPDQLADTVRWLNRIKATDCRNDCLERFHYRAMVKNYLKVYEGMLAQERK